ncbi:hypothetical protein USDA257_c60070 [Sinorhizobium fredii USDA 257]|uniref:Uncharacterized protein n=1 Tax=Sinorhizobium fredii (strain USDA 257) TaxID=1185652 RepID=I3XF55_SINF2|nr:hypothetical protein USDA257_c60070 [Sinorhizobium fredii USDA 257]
MTRLASAIRPCLIILPQDLVNLEARYHSQVGPPSAFLSE